MPSKKANLKRKHSLQENSKDGAVFAVTQNKSSAIILYSNVLNFHLLLLASHNLNY